MLDNLLQTFNTIFSENISASVPAVLILLLLLIPGFICVQIQNRDRGCDRVELTGTSYILFVLIVSCFLMLFFWLMHQLCIEYKIQYKSMLPMILTLYIAFWHSDLHGAVKTSDTFNDLRKYISDNWFRVLIDLGMLVLFLASFSYSWKFALLYIVSHHCLHNFIFNLVPKVEDVFYHTFKNLYENKKPVLMTLKNGQVYVGFVLAYPKNISKPTSEQSVSIMQLMSGYRRDIDKIISLPNDYQPLYTGSDNTNNNTGVLPIKYGELKLSIPRTEIVSFGEFNPTVYEYFKTLTE